jgi:hypothetical protein
MRTLARHDRHGRVWARWILANVVLARVWAVHRHDQQVYGSVLDMIITKENGQREERGGGGRHGHGMDARVHSLHFLHGCSIGEGAGEVQEHS